ncbi:hypothetical protein PUNSTDRAFT_51663 [Punctularia strigosozonata HHB-11173 SS5]|uniref:uncharacterized protein n=1 Tax=Punctularia strigosozonata (strain HHB-11173) TaxID=741275 RepID=UPI00044164D8|nr:uncharacterized protein PUNSTDRAFT_51663 [Punctularia strigosozonata HHB-11173 SS5]EIN09385.1 hypothetical protein PUNSTDRAFT_51663 [Punctularia strigosozonata HHB-11173 SS5]
MLLDHDARSVSEHVICHAVPMRPTRAEGRTAVLSQQLFKEASAILAQLTLLCIVLVHGVTYLNSDRSVSTSNDAESEKARSVPLNLAMFGGSSVPKVASTNPRSHTDYQTIQWIQMRRHGFHDPMSGRRRWTTAGDMR